MPPSAYFIRLLVVWFVMRWSLFYTAPQPEFFATTSTYILMGHVLCPIRGTRTVTVQDAGTYVVQAYLYELTK